MPEEVIKKTNKNQKRDYIFATGKRRESIARIRLYTQIKDGLVWDTYAIKKGDILVNSKPIAEYFPSEIERFTYTEPIRIANAQQQNYTMTIRVTGGGHHGQLEAVVCAIANGLSKLDPEKYRGMLKKKGFLTRDSRTRQRRNVGTGGKARRQKQSPKR